jgi:hypothetical protein
MVRVLCVAFTRMVRFCIALLISSLVCTGSVHFSDELRPRLESNASAVRLFYFIGASKCATTSLAFALGHHPLVSHKGIMEDHVFGSSFPHSLRAGSHQ